MIFLWFVFNIHSRIYTKARVKVHATIDFFFNLASLFVVLRVPYFQHIATTTDSASMDHPRSALDWETDINVDQILFDQHRSCISIAAWRPLPWSRQLVFSFQTQLPSSHYCHICNWATDWSQEELSVAQHEQAHLKVTVSSARPLLLSAARCHTGRYQLSTISVHCPHQRNNHHLIWLLFNIEHWLMYCTDNTTFGLLSSELKQDRNI